MKVKQRSVELEAFVITEDTATEVAAWCHGVLRGEHPDLVIKTMDGWLAIAPGGWIVRGADGAFSYYSQDTFDLTFDESISDEDSSLVQHAKRELDVIGMTEDTTGVDKLGREGVLDLVRVFASQGHSGSSADWMLDVVTKLLRFEALSELTDAADEWIEVAVGTWQSRRNPGAFSTDGGKTYYLVSERELAGDLDTTPLHRSKETENA